MKIIYSNIKTGEVYDENVVKRMNFRLVSETKMGTEIIRLIDKVSLGVQLELFDKLETIDDSKRRNKYELNKKYRR